MPGVAKEFEKCWNSKNKTTGNNILPRWCYDLAVWQYQVVMRCDAMRCDAMRYWLNVAFLFHCLIVLYIPKTFFTYLKTGLGVFRSDRPYCKREHIPQEFQACQCCQVGNLTYLILFYLILSYLILSYLILSYLILSYLIEALKGWKNDKSVISVFGSRYCFTLRSIINIWWRQNCCIINSLI